MPTEEDELNPFAPPSAASIPARREAVAVPGPPNPRRSWLASLGLWSGICTLSAAPSFAWGLGTIAGDQVAAMLLGIVTFICGYTLADQFTQGHGWRRNPAVRLTLKIGYMTRVAISVIFPVGATLDVICGVFSIQLAQHLGPLVTFRSSGSIDARDNTTFLGALLVTLIQGGVANVVLAAYMLCVLGLVLVVRGLRT